jgi:hypothetical protein
MELFFHSHIRLNFRHKGKVLQYHNIASGAPFAWGHAVAQLVETLHKKPEGRGFDFPMVLLEFLIDIILPAHILALGLTQPLTEMSTRNIS